MYKNYLKRLLDFFGALLLMPIVGVFIVVIGSFIYIEDHGCIFYKAQRRGFHGKEFEMLKFRSMIMDAPDIRNQDNSTYNSPDDPRVTHIGRILRSTSIDEIPQIINILKGDMSFIGPRPVTVDRSLEDLDEIRRKRMEVRPGLTGYSQAYYRNSISQNMKLKYDAEYADNISLKKDLQIFFKTIDTVLKRRNIYKNH